MRLKLLLVLGLAVLLIVDVEAARDRKKKTKARNDETATEEEEGALKSGSGFSEDKRKETKDRVMALVERTGEKGHEKKEEESSEEKEEDKKNATAKEIEIPKRLRRTFHLGKAKEVNDGEQKPLEKKPSQTHQRLRRTHELGRTKEINDGEQKPLENKPSQTHKCGPNCQHRRSLRRMRRQEKALKKSDEINDGVQTPLDTKPAQTEMSSRIRRNQKTNTQKALKHGHRGAGHPHGKRGPKEHNVKSKKNNGPKHRAERHTYESFMNEPNHPQTPEEKQFVYGKHIKTHGKRPPTKEDLARVESEKSIARGRTERDIPAAPLDERTREAPQKKVADHDQTLVSADAAEIREIN